MDRSYHRGAYEHHRAKAAAYRIKAESHLARASEHRSRLGFGVHNGIPDTHIVQARDKMYQSTPCPCGCKEGSWCTSAQYDHQESSTTMGARLPWRLKPVHLLALGLSPAQIQALGYSLD